MMNVVQKCFLDMNHAAAAVIAVSTTAMSAILIECTPVPGAPNISLNGQLIS